MWRRRHLKRARAPRTPVASGARRRARAGFRRAGLTLLEIVIAIAVVLALLAISIPMTLRMLDERAFESASEELRGQLLLARAEAMARGQPLEARYRTDPPAIEVATFDLGSRAIDAGEYRGALRDAGAGSGALDIDLDPDGELPDRLDEPWAYQRLGDGLALTDQPPRADWFVAGEAPMLTLEEGGSPFAPGAAPRRIRLGVYLADGSVLLGRRVWLVDRSGRRSTIRLNPWTGEPVLERLPDLRPDLARDESEEDMEDSFDVDEGFTTGAAEEEEEESR